MKDLDFRVGDVVTSVLHGVGVVINYYKGKKYPVEVKFKNSEYQIFTRDGRFNPLCYERILYHGEIRGNFYAAAEVKPVRISYKQRTLDKWFWHMMNPGKSSEDYINATGRSEKRRGMSGCWLCELIKFACFDCPIKGFRDNNCYQPGSAYQEWKNNKTSENARTMYDTILNTWEE